MEQCSNEFCKRAMLIGNSDIRRLADEYIRDETHRKMAIDKLVNGLTYDELADKYCMGRRRAVEIVVQSKARMFDGLL